MNPREPAHWEHAPTPPMGWNSWDIFGTTLTESQAHEQADAMARHLLPAGYDVFTVDVQWYEPDSVSHRYQPGAELTMDGYSRLIPAAKKFPSAAGGAGFKPLADYVHSKGLRFGIHIMRGIPRQAVERNTPVLGGDARASEIAVTNSTCAWNPDMYGVDATRPGGRAYYDSLFALYAEWGVDFVKVDDISRPYTVVQEAEIAAIRHAIDKTGRPIVLSLSPGATPTGKGKHAEAHANLWRITDDFWDRWSALLAMFERAHAWTPFRGPGHWPDADMLPIGVIDFGRRTHFTPDEQRTLMTLWAIARSPLIFGGDMTKLDVFTKELLTNPGMLAVNQHSMNNRQLSREKNLIVWTADMPCSPDKYVALFNAQSVNDSLEFASADYASPVISGEGQSQEIILPVAGGRRLALFVMNAGDHMNGAHAAWVDPLLHGPQGGRKLTDLPWTYADAGWGQVRVDRTCDDQPLTVRGRPAAGIGTHASSTIIYDLPAGYDTFSTTGVATDRGSVMFGVLVDRDSAVVAEVSEVRVAFADLGLTGTAGVRDLWSGQSLGEHAGEFSRPVPIHGSGLYRVSPR